MISFCKEQNILDIKIKDNYIRFWFAFVYPNLSFIESGNSGIAMNKIRKGLVSRHIAFVYENICRELKRKAGSVGWRKENRQVWYVLFSASRFTGELKEIAAERKDLLLVDETSTGG